MRKKSVTLYNDAIQDHFKNPRHFGALKDADFTVEGREESCGDSIVYYGIVTDGVLTSVGFTGQGCMISQAGASLLNEHVINKKLTDINNLDEAFMARLINLELGPNRSRCALLPLSTLQNGITLYRTKE